MTEILDIEEIWALVGKLYGKKKEGWNAYRGMTKNKLIELIVKGPDAVIEIVQDTPETFMFEDISRLPTAWRPLGKGAVLDEDLERIRIAGKTDEASSGSYGLRPVSKRTFETLMKLIDMKLRGEPIEKVLATYDRMMCSHIRTPVAGYGELRTPVYSIGPISSRPSLEDISTSQRKLKAELESQVMAMQRKRMSYVI
jgi:hypothetical protein